MKRPRVYRDRRPLTIALRITAAVLALALAFCVFAFFWCQRYIVIENGELRLEPPWETSASAE